MNQRSLLPGTLTAMLVWAGCPLVPDVNSDGPGDAGKLPVADAGTPECPALETPVCADDQELRAGTDENGCDTRECVDLPPVTIECPEPAAPECADDEMLQGDTDEDGCQFFTCVPAAVDAGIPAEDAGTPADDAGTSTEDAGVTITDAGDSTSDAGTPSAATIQMLLDEAEGGADDVNYTLEDVYVTYVRTIGYTLQAEAAGPAIFVYTGGEPGVAVGNKITLQVTSLGEYRSLLQIDGSTVINNDDGAYDVLGNLGFDLGADDGTALTRDAVARLVTVSGALVMSGSGRNWVIQYGSNDIESSLYAYEGELAGLCAGAVVDITNAYIDSYDDVLSVKNYYAADFANLDSSGCESDDAGISDDAGATGDAGDDVSDAGTADDAGADDSDAGSESDAGDTNADAGTNTDAGDTNADAGTNTDAGDTNDAGTTAGAFVINEVDYDQPGSDTAEFVELHNGTDEAIDLSGYALLLVNGSNSSVYTTIDLSAAGSLSAGQYLVVGSAAVMVPTSALSVALDGSIQNGAPDAVALVSATEVVDAFVYEGALSADLGAPYGSTDFGDGSTLTDSTDGSLSRKVDGVDTGDYAADWAFTSTVTPGSANAF